MIEPNEECGPLRYDDEQEPPLLPVWVYVAVVALAAIIAAAVGIVTAYGVRALVLSGLGVITTMVLGAYGAILWVDMGLPLWRWSRVGFVAVVVAFALAAWFLL